MKNPFTQLGNKFTMTLDKVRQTVFRQRQKDAGTKKETGREAGGGGSSIKVHLVAQQDEYGVYGHRSQESKATLRRAKKRRLRNKIAARSRRINRIKRKVGKAA